MKSKGKIFLSNWKGYYSIHKFVLVHKYIKSFGIVGRWLGHLIMPSYDQVEKNTHNDKKRGEQKKLISESIMVLRSIDFLLNWSE